MKAGREGREPAAEPTLGPPSGEVALAVEALADRTVETVADEAGLAEAARANPVGPIARFGAWSEILATAGVPHKLLASATSFWRSRNAAADRMVVTLLRTRDYIFWERS